MKRIYVGKEINAGGVTIKVKQVLGSGDSEIRERVKRIATCRTERTSVSSVAKGSLAPRPRCCTNTRRQAGRILKAR